MSQRSVKCTDCGRHNRLPEELLIEAHCGRCESALTYYTWVAAALRSRGLRRGLQVVGAVVVLSAMFGGDIVAWWESEPFRLTEARTGTAGGAEPKDSLAREPLAEGQH